MTTLREAAQQALEALEEYAPQHGNPDDMDAAITALRAALAQQEQEPVAWMMINRYHPSLARSLHWTPQTDWHITWDAAPLYTSPPRREWQSLSKDDALKLWGMRSDGPSNLEIISFARAVEAKLKEKNHG